MLYSPLIEVGFVDTFDPAPSYFIQLLKQRFNVIRNDSSPKYLFFGDRNFGSNHQKSMYDNCVKIFYTGENERPANYKANYYMGFDHIFADNYLRFPLYVLNTWHLKQLGLGDPADQFRFTFEQTLPSEKGFCGFVQSNPNCQFRNHLFHKISEYKKIDSAGPLFNNTGFVLPRNEHGIAKKLEFLSTKRFALAAENGSYPGYATEKLLEAYLARSIPIYWGSPTIELDFNPGCMVSRHNFPSDASFLDRIKELEEDNSAFLEVYMEPLYLPHQGTQRYEEQFLDWFEEIVRKTS